MAALREGKPLTETLHLQPNAAAMLDELVWWARALKQAREWGREAAVSAPTRRGAIVRRGGRRDD